MKPSSRRAVAMSILVVFIVLVTLGITQLSGEDESLRVGEGADTVALEDVTIDVPEGWSVFRLSQDQPCPPAQDKTVVVSEGGFGGDCQSTKVGNSLIWLGNLSPVETTPPTTMAIGNTTGWVREIGPGIGWLAAVPGSNIQITFSAAVDETTRTGVVNSIRKG
jgi:hypothetical protein